MSAEITGSRPQNTSETHAELVRLYAELADKHSQAEALLRSRSPGHDLQGPVKISFMALQDEVASLLAQIKAIDG